MLVREVKFRSGGDECAGTVYIPAMEGPPKQLPALVIGHGLALVKEALAPAAEQLASAGYVVLALDYRRWGLSGGEPRNLLRPLDEVEDFRNGVSFVQRLREVDAARVGIWGVSFGGGVALQTAAVDRRVRCVVAQSPALNGRDCQKDLRGMARYHEMLERLREDWERRFEGHEGERVPATGILDDANFPIIPSSGSATFWEQYPTYKNEMLVESLEHLLIWAPEALIDQIAPTPLLIVTNGGHDLHHPLNRIQDAFRRAGEPKQLAILPYDVRGLYVEPGLGEALKLAIAWYQKYL